MENQSNTTYSFLPVIKQQLLGIDCKLHKFRFGFLGIEIAGTPTATGYRDRHALLASQLILVNHIWNSFLILGFNLDSQSLD